MRVGLNETTCRKNAKEELNAELVTDHLMRFRWVSTKLHGHIDDNTVCGCLCIKYMMPQSCAFRCSDVVYCTSNFLEEQGKAGSSATTPTKATPSC